jgi:hypothetical protein
MSKWGFPRSTEVTYRTIATPRAVAAAVDEEAVRRDDSRVHKIVQVLVG